MGKHSKEGTPAFKLLSQEETEDLYSSYDEIEASPETVEYTFEDKVTEAIHFEKQFRNVVFFTFSIVLATISTLVALSLFFSGWTFSHTCVAGVGIISLIGYCGELIKEMRVRTIFRSEEPDVFDTAVKRVSRMSFRERNLSVNLSYHGS